MFKEIIFFLAAFCLTVSGRPQNEGQVTPAPSGNFTLIIVPFETVTESSATALTNFTEVDDIGEQNELNITSHPVQPVILEEVPTTNIPETTQETTSSAIANSPTTTGVPETTTEATPLTTANPPMVYGSTRLVGFVRVTAVVPAGNHLGDWQKGATYAVGDTVTFDGATYRALSAHTAIADTLNPKISPIHWVPV